MKSNKLGSESRGGWEGLAAAKMADSVTALDGERHYDNCQKYTSAYSPWSQQGKAVLTGSRRDGNLQVSTFEHKNANEAADKMDPMITLGITGEAVGSQPVSSLRISREKQGWA